MKLTAAELARLAGGTVDGDGAALITGAAPLETAGPGDLAFLADPARLDAAAASKAGVLLTLEGYAVPLKKFGGAVVTVKKPRLAFLLALHLLEKERRPAPAPGVHPSAVVAPSAQVGAGAHIGPCAVVEEDAVIGEGAAVGAQCYLGRGARIGPRTRLYPGVRIMDACEAGADCILHAGAVIGSDGYGYVRHEGRHEKVPQLGRVALGDRVEIGANCAIDRAALDTTRIGDGTKIDNLVHIAHNVKTGSDCLIMAQTGIAGSVELGSGVTIAGHSVLSDHITIGDRTVVMGKTGVMSSLGPDQLVFGHIARPRMETLRIEAALGRLPGLLAAVRKIQKHLGLDDKKDHK
jgi:UDP-3-O-[3-hydroxymyristoyl] glucosamine N-acyltransferase